MTVDQSSAATATVREIGRHESLGPFIEVAWHINASDANWIAPLRISLKAALDRSNHPFHRHAEVAYFVAERRGVIVGRIAAIVNHLHNEFHSDQTGFFGLFECENDRATATTLFDAASDWLRKRDRDRIRGPVNFSTNEEVASPGVLIHGFDRRPTIMMGHNPSYYQDLHEAAGFAKAKDLLAFLLDEPEATPTRGTAVLDRLLKREGAVVRSMDLTRFRQDVDAMKEVYNSAWSKNWGFVPMTDAEFDYLAKEFRPIVDPDLCLIAEAAGEPIGFSLALPDINEALRYLPDGKLFPFGFLKLLWHKRRIRGIRVLTLGFKPRFHHAGLGIAFYLKTWTAGVRKGYVWGEASWILEDNHEMVRALERMGGAPYRRYRIYERAI